MDHPAGFRTPVTRHYVDTRPYVSDSTPGISSNVALPLIDYLPRDTQESVRRYIKASDKFMSLASALLKYRFIHQNAKIPWSQVTISRTPKPHARPYWDPPLAWHGDGYDGLEFNVSHQAGIIVLLGCRTPDRPVVPATSDFSDDLEDEGDVIDPNPKPHNAQVRVGVDIACTKEPRRTPDLSTQAKLDAWVDTFAEMFSEREREVMKRDPATPADGENGVKIRWNWQVNKWEAKARRFYTCWALKEAYIKLVGEGLLADWLRELEFLNVIPPKRGERFRAEDAGLQIVFEQADITNTVQTNLEGLDDNFILATMMRGVDEDDTQGNTAWTKIDIDKDIKPCAEGICDCLN